MSIQDNVKLVRLDRYAGTISSATPYTGAWRRTEWFSRLVGTLYCSNTIDLMIDQSNSPIGTTDASMLAEYITTCGNTLASNLAFSVENVSLWARMRLVNNTASATAANVVANFLGRVDS